jgi:hypothetical protein
MDQPADLCFEYPGADVILRSRDFYQFRVPKSFIINNSPILGELIHKTLGPLANVQDVASLPVIELPESGPILHNLFSFLFPGIPIVPSTTVKAMKLLSVAQKYQMDFVLAHIRLSISRHDPRSTQPNAAFGMYALAQKYRLRQEALQAARTLILKYPINIEDLKDKLDMMPGASLYGLWKYSEDVRSALVSDLSEFRASAARGTLTGLPCVELSSSKIPLWLDDYISSIGDTPNLFDLIEFSLALARHTKEKAGCRTCACASLPSQKIRNFWEALASVVDGSFDKVGVIYIDKLLIKLTSCRQTHLYFSKRNGRIFKTNSI